MRLFQPRHLWRLAVRRKWTDPASALRTLWPAPPPPLDRLAAATAALRTVVDPLLNRDVVESGIASIEDVEVRIRVDMCLSLEPRDSSRGARARARAERERDTHTDRSSQGGPLRVTLDVTTAAHPDARDIAERCAAALENAKNVGGGAVELARLRRNDGLSFPARARQKRKDTVDNFEREKRCARALSGSA